MVKRGKGEKIEIKSMKNRQKPIKIKKNVEK